MKPWHDMCRVMLHTRSIVESLDLANTQPKDVRAQCEELHKQWLCLEAAAQHLTPAHFKPPASDTEHMQLITALSDLVKALVTKLDVPETGTAHTSKRNSLSGAAAPTISSFLWYLLLLPVVHQHAGLRYGQQAGILTTALSETPYAG